MKNMEVQKIEFPISTNKPVLPKQKGIHNHILSNIKIFQENIVMSLEPKPIKVTCNNPICNFVKIYKNQTIESITSHRKFWSKIPVMDNECSHADCTITEEN